MIMPDLIATNINKIIIISYATSDHLDHSPHWTQRVTAGQDKCPKRGDLSLYTCTVLQPSCSEDKPN